MKKIYYSYLVLTCILMLVITIAPLEKHVIKNMKFAEENILTASTIEMEDAITTENTTTEKEIYQQIEKEFIANNGKKLILGSIKSMLNETGDIPISISSDKTTIYITKNMQPNETLSYATIDDFIILLKNNAEINPLKTSYYQSSQQLVINLLPGKKLYELEIYTEKTPGLVIAKTSTRWKYEQRILKIRTTDGFRDEVSIFFTHMPLMGTVFLEDTKNVEILDYKTIMLLDEMDNINNEIRPYEQELAEIDAKINETIIEKNNLVGEKDVLVNEITNLNKTAEEIENRISFNVVVAPSGIVISTIVAIVLLFILIDLFLFKKKKGAKK